MTDDPTASGSNDAAHDQPPGSDLPEAKTRRTRFSIVWLLPIIVGIIIAVRRRGDWKIWAVLVGFLGGWLPWAQYLHRTTFTSAIGGSW